MGFEHSIANMYFIPTAMMFGAPGVTWGNMILNILFVSIGISNE